MAPRRIIAEHLVTDWQEQLRAAVARAYDHQLANVNNRLGGTHGLTAAGGTMDPWNDDDWDNEVDQEVQPVLERITNDVTNAAKLGLAAALTWGMASSAGAMVSRARQTLSSAGSAIGGRINVKADLLASANRDLEAGRAYRNARALEKAERVMRQAQTSMADALDGGASTFDHLSETLVNSFAQWASQDAASYVAGYMGNTYSDATVTWNAVGDDRTREEHADADGQEVALNEAFIVGGEPLMYPGDPSGSDWNTINCRCWLTYDSLDTPEEEAAREA
jgi:hypothetical protein